MDFERRDAPACVPAAARLAVLYDADCGLCKWLLSWLLRRDRTRVLRPVALQGDEARELLADLSPQERMASWHLISASGERDSGGAALAPLLRALPGGAPAALVVARLPRLTDRAYRWVAANRTQLSRLVPARSKRRASELVRARERAHGQASA